MKTKFIGTVNGTEYDNVKDYNAALTNALQTGTPVDASSQTYSVPDEDEKANEECNGYEIKANDPEIHEKVFAEYDLDELNGTSDEEYINNFKNTYSDELVDELAKEFANDKDIVKALRGDIEENLEMKEINNSVLETLTSDVETLKSKINLLGKKLEDKTRQINLCKSAAEVINHSINYKNKLLKKLGSEQFACVDGKVTKPEKVSAPLSTFDDALNGLEKLFKEIWS